MSTSEHHSPGEAQHSASDRMATTFLTRIAREAAVGQLRRGEGAMLRLGSENGIPMLDWVEAVPRLLADPAAFESVESEARALIDRGIRQIIWSGMGGSVLTVQVLRALGFCGGGITIHPLDSTDPHALNLLLRRLADGKGLSLPVAANAGDASSPTAASVEALTRALFSNVVMVGVAMGKTSEEPITHLEWFADLLRQCQLDLAEHMLVMAIPDSYLERYALSHGLKHLPLQLDGGHGTPGRMSAPATRVFLLPVALDLADRGAAPGTLRTVLKLAWSSYDLDGAESHPNRHPFVRLAAAMASVASAGCCGLTLALPGELDALRWWSEQLMEESLGKGGKGVVVFSDQVLAPLTSVSGHSLPMQRARVVPEDTAAPDAIGSARKRKPSMITIHQPLLGAGSPEERLAGIAAVMLGLQLTTALYGFLCEIPFAGQPAVELYKSQARELRAAGDPLHVARTTTYPLVKGRSTLLPPPGVPSASEPVGAVMAALAEGLGYLDLTINGELTPEVGSALAARLHTLGNTLLGVPVKLRRAPASYHSTEQSEMDGPSGLVSLRALATRPEACLLGQYDATFLHAQAVGTWMAMNAAQRPCFLLLYEGTGDEVGAALCDLLDNLARALSAPMLRGAD